MVEYKLDVEDWAISESRLEFLVKLEKFLRELSKEGTIGKYALKTPHNVTCIFKSEAEG